MSFVKYWKKIVLLFFAVPIGLLVILITVSQFVPAKPPPDFLITKNMMDLNQIKFITQFRSCNGHKSMSQQTRESPSSMAHYVYFDSKGGNAVNTIKIFAPFDGYVNHFLVEGLVDNEAFALVPKSSKFPWWPFNQYRIHVSHAHTLPQYSGTAVIKAGDLIGYADLPESYSGGPIAFDIRMGVIALPPDIKDGNGEPLKNMDSIFNYMTPEVFDEYKATVPGLENPQDFIIPADWRASHPCKYQGGKGPYFDSSPEDYLNEKYRGAVYIGVRNDPNGIREALKCFRKTINPDCNTK